MYTVHISYEDINVVVNILEYLICIVFLQANMNICNTDNDEMMEGYITFHSNVVNINALCHRHT